MEPSSEVIGYEYDRDTKIWYTVTLEDFNNEMEELLRMFSTWKETTEVSYPLVEVSNTYSTKKK